MVVVTAWWFWCVVVVVAVVWRWRFVELVCGGVGCVGVVYAGGGGVDVAVCGDGVWCWRWCVVVIVDGVW